jgi:chlorite dismutase
MFVPLVITPWGLRGSAECKKRQSISQRAVKSERKRLATVKTNKLRVWSKESLAKKSDYIKQLWRNPVWRANQIAKRIGKKATDATKAKMSKSRIGRKHSETTKEKMRIAVALSLANDPKRLKDMKDRCLAISHLGAAARRNSAKLMKAIRGEKVE